MLPPASLLLVLLAAQPARAANDFVNFPSEFGLDMATTFTWENIEGYIAGIRVVDAHSEEGDDNWLLEPDCDDTCTAFDNNGTYSFGGSSAVDSSGAAFAVGGGYTIKMLYSTTQKYDDVDTSTTTVASPSFRIASTVSTTTTSAASSSTATTGSSTATTGASSTSTNPASTASSSATSSSSSSGDLSTGIKVGIAIGAALTLLIIAWLAWRKRRRHQQQQKLHGLGSEDGNDIWRANTASSAADASKKGGNSWESTMTGESAGGQANPFLDCKVELPTQPWEGNTHELANSEITPVPAPAPAPVELPAEPVVVRSAIPLREMDGVQKQYNDPSRLSSNSLGGVSDVTSLSNGTAAAAAAGAPPVEMEVSPVSPMAPLGPKRPVPRRPVPGEIPRQQQQQQVVPDAEMGLAGPAVGKETSGLPGNDESLVWKSLWGGSVHDSSKPGKGSY